MKKYRLTVFFLVASLAAMSIAAIAVNRIAGDLAKDNLVRITEEDTTRFASHIQHMMRMMEPVEAMDSTQDKPSAHVDGNTTKATQQPMARTLEFLAGPHGLSVNYHSLVQGLNIVQFLLLDMNGLTVWSTDSLNVDTTRPRTNGPAYWSARRGEATSEFVPGKEITALDGARRKTDVVEAHLPLRDTTSGEVVGVVQLYRDVGDHVAIQVAAARSTVLTTTAATMGGLFLVLSGFIVVADVTIHRSRMREIALGESQLVERQRAEDALRESETRYRRLVELSPEAIFVNSDGKIVYSNGAGLKLLGATLSEQVVGRPTSDFIPHDDRDFVAERFRQIYEEGVTTPLTEGKIVRLDGRVIDVESTGALVTYRGKAAAQSVMRDITERKQAEEQIKVSLREKEVLLKEVHHRVKNNLQVISSLLYLQSGYIQDVRALEVFADSRTRVKSMALIHEQLYQSSDLSRIDFGAYARSLVGDLSRTYALNPAAIKVQVNVGEVLLGIDTAIPCGLIINELVSNGLKYAFPDGRAGQVCVELRADDDTEYTLVVGDNGVGLPGDLDFRKSDSLGLELVRTLTDQLEGTIDLNTRDGTEYRITFPELKPVPGGQHSVQHANSDSRG